MFKSSLKYIYTTLIALVFNKQDTNLKYINFSNIYHTFQLDEDIPYLASYIPEENMYLQRYYVPFESTLETLMRRWKMKPDVMTFYIKLPKIQDMKEDLYFQVHLFENKQINIRISLQAKYRLLINKKELNNIIQNGVNKLITRLNDMEGGIFNTMILNEKLNLITDINDKNLEIKGINFIIDNKKANKENFLILLSKLEDCLNPFFYTDYKAEGEKHKIEYRFKRFDSYKNGNEIDKYLFTKLHNNIKSKKGERY
jgi:hypothetical protein